MRDNQPFWHMIYAHFRGKAVTGVIAQAKAADQRPGPQPVALAAVTTISCSSGRCWGVRVTPCLAHLPALHDPQGKRLPPLPTFPMLARCSLSPRPMPRRSEPPSIVAASYRPPSSCAGYSPASPAPRRRRSLPAPSLAGSRCQRRRYAVSNCCAPARSVRAASHPLPRRGCPCRHCADYGRPQPRLLRREAFL